MVITGRTRNAFGIISHVGSNPTFSAKKARPLKQRTCFLIFKFTIVGLFSSKKTTSSH